MQRRTILVGIVICFFWLLAISTNAAAAPDLVVQDIWVEDLEDSNTTTITSGQPFTLYVRVKNVGDENTTGFKTTIYMNGTELGSGDADYLAPGESIDWYMAEVNHSELGSCALRGYVDSEGAITESDEDNNRTENITIVKADWAILAYLDGDNNLEGYMISDFFDLSWSGSTPDVSIVVQMDRRSGYSTSYGDWTDCNRFFLTQYLYPYSYNAVENLGEVNMGAESVFTDFLEWGVNTYQADHYMVIPSNHGGSWLGCCWDDTNGHDRLRMYEMENSFGDMADLMGHNVDIVLFDDCSMGSIEVATQIDQDVDYVVASETVGWTSSFPYWRSGSSYGIAEYLVANPSIGPRNYAIEIVNLSNPVNSASYDTQSIAAYDMSKIDDLVSDVDDLSELLLDAMPEWRDEIIEARADSEYFVGPYGGDHEELIDLHDFVDRVQSGVDDTAIDSKAQEIMDAIGPDYDEVVIRERHTSYVDYCHGMSIYFPEESSDYKSYYTSSNDFTDATDWNEFLAYVYDDDPPYNPSSFNVSPSTGSWTETSTASISWSTPSDNGSSGVHGYSILWSSTPGLPSEVVDTTSGSVQETLTDGTWYLNIRTVDNAGNWADSYASVGPFQIDTEDPVTTHDHDGKWHNSDVNVTFSATDTGSGIDETYYRVDGGSWQTGTYVVIPAPSDHSNDGNHTVEFYSTDVYGHIEDTTIITVSIDTEAPELRVWFDTASCKIRFTAMDDLDGAPGLVLTAKFGRNRIYGLQDHAGNTLSVKLSLRKVKISAWKQYTVQFKWISYNGEAPIDANAAKMVVKFKTSRAGIKTLKEQITCDSDWLKATYRKNSDRTTMKCYDGSLDKTVHIGLVCGDLSTDGGSIVCSHI